MNICIIPAKKNSKRFVKKNFKKIKGVHLFQRSILHAKTAKMIDKIFVTSDSDYILKVSKKMGCEAIKRSAKLSSVKADINDVIYDVIKKSKINLKDKIILLQPTTPFRPKQLIDKLILLANKTKKTIITTEKISSDLLKSIIELKKNKFKFLDQNYFNKNSQDLPRLFKPNGSVYIFKGNDFLKKKKIPLKNVSCYEIRDRKYNIDIDLQKDYELAKTYI